MQVTFRNILLLCFALLNISCGLTVPAPGWFVHFAGKGDEKAVRTMLEHGRPVDERWKGETALMAASGEGEYDTAKLLIEHGADVNLRYKDGLPPLMLAAFNGHSSVVRLLLENGADAKAKSDFGETALDIARLGGHEATAVLIQEMTKSKGTE